jgi:1-acyl-sn-glycerol-3-phosphate acyltransferase
MKYVISFYVWIFLVITAISFFPVVFIIWILILPFDRDRRLFHFITTIWSSLYLHNNPWWKLKIEFRERIQRGKSYVIISNHQSMLDILMLFQLYTLFKWVSKIEVFRTPIVGWMMRMNAYISLRRGKLASIKDMMDKCLNVLRKGNSVLIFPEGTRSADGEMKSFQEGAFKLALEAKRDILPVVIYGTANALPKKGFILQKKQRIYIRILESHSFEEFRYKPFKEVILDIHEEMKNNLKDLKSYDE